MSISFQPKSDSEEALDFYRRALTLLAPFWAGELETARPISKRIAIRLSELGEHSGDLLIGLVLMRGRVESVPEHVLQVAIVTAQLARQLQLPKRFRYELALYALLHHLGHETRGSLVSDPGYLAQRSLLTFLLSPEPNISHYRQAQIAFQLDLGQDHRGQPRLELAIQQHPLTPFITVCHDFTELVSGSPFRATKEILAYDDALLQIKQRRERYHPGLIEALSSIFDPAPVGSLVTLNDGRRGMVMRAITWMPEWEVRVLTLDGPAALIVLTEAGSEFKIVERLNPQT